MADYLKTLPPEYVITMVIVPAIVFFILGGYILFSLGKNRKKLAKYEKGLHLFKGLINQVGDCVLLIDEEGIVRIANDQFLKYCGKPQEKIVGKSIQRIQTDYVHSDHQELFKKSIEENGFYEFNINFFHSSGDTIPFHVVIKPLDIGTKKGDNQKFFGVTAIDLKKANEKDNYINQQEDELLEIQHLAHLGYWEIDYATKKIYWSRELYSILGYEEGEVEPNLDIIYWMAYEDDQNRVWKSFLSAFQAQEKVDTHYRIKNNRGEMLDIYLRIRHFFSPKNEHLRTIGILQDVTKQVDLREELNAQLIFTDTVLNNSRLLYIECNSNFEVRNINNQVSQLIGINSEAARERQLLEIFGKLNRTHRAFIQENMDFKKPMPMKDFGGKIHYIQWDHSIFKNRNNEMLNILSGIDITETIEKRKELEASFVLDPVTKLPNRLKLIQVLDNYFKKNGQNFDKNLALLFVYIDGIFVVSDGFGQHAEDELMRSISERLYAAVGKYGLFVRRYAVQFVLFYPHDKNNEKITEIIELITELMKIPFIIRGIPIKLRSHIGISKFPDHTRTKEDLVRFGTGAMREAQRLKVNYYVYNESLETDLKKELNAFKTNNN